MPFSIVLNQSLKPLSSVAIFVIIHLPFLISLKTINTLIGQFIIPIKPFICSNKDETAFAGMVAKEYGIIPGPRANCFTGSAREYRINISGTIFLLAGMAAILIVLGTVSFQVLKASLTNPGKHLKSE